MSLFFWGAVSIMSFNKATHSSGLSVSNARSTIHLWSSIPKWRPEWDWSLNLRVLVWNIWSKSFNPLKTWVRMPCLNSVFSCSVLTERLSSRFISTWKFKFLIQPKHVEAHKVVVLYQNNDPAYIRQSYWFHFDNNIHMILNHRYRWDLVSLSNNCSHFLDLIL